MRIGVCGIACEKCPMMTKRACPNGADGCVPKLNRFCEVATCAFERGERYCFECDRFPCETTKEGPIAYDYCKFISGTWKD